jgi:hypothetical protein
MEKSYLEIHLEFLLKLCDTDLQSEAADLIRDDMEESW